MADLASNRFYKRFIQELPAVGALSASLLFSLVLFLYVTVPAARAASEKSVLHEKYRKTVSSSDGYNALKRSIEAKKAGLERNLQSVASDLVQPGNLPGLLQMLIAKANAADILFVKIEPEGESADEDFIRYPVTLEMTTTYHSLARFVASLENAPQMVHVDRLGITTREGTTIDAVIRVTCFISSENQ